MSAVSTRRALLLAAGASGLAGCVGMPVVGGVAGATGTEARKLLEACAKAHGWDAWKGIRDISVSYEGEWYSLVKRLQPELVDDRYRQHKNNKYSCYVHMSHLNLLVQRMDSLECIIPGPPNERYD